MTHFDILAAGNTARCVSHRGILTAGMTGAAVTVAFDSLWDGLQRMAVFRCGETCVDVLLEEGSIPIPAPVLTADEALYLGLYGTDGEKTVLPTVWVELATVHPAADPSGDTSTDPSLPIWATLQARIDALGTPVTDEHINSLIDAKLAEIPIAEEASF